MKKLATLAALMAMTLSSQAADLYLYAGAGLKEPVEKIVKQFEQNTGNKVTVEYGGSGQILPRYNQVKTGDLFLSESNLRLGIGDAKAMALGKGAEKIFELSGYQQALNEKVVVKAATVKQLMMYLLNGDVDAAVVGRSGAWKVRDKVEILPNPQGTPQEKVTLALLSSSAHPTEAKQLFDFFYTEGVKYFTDEGFLPVK